VRNDHKQILDELRDLPPEQLEHLLRLIGEYKTSVQASPPIGSGPSPSDLAGIWSDMSQEEADQALQLYKRRKTYWTVREIDVSRV
jgi:hypothetical protein